MWTGTRTCALLVIALGPHASVCLYAQLNAANTITNNIAFQQCSSTNLKCADTYFQYGTSFKYFATLGSSLNRNHFQHDSLWLKSDEVGGPYGHNANLWFGSAGGNGGTRFDYFMVFVTSGLYWGSTNSGGTTSYVYHNTMGSDSRIKLHQVEVEPQKSMEIVDALKVKQYYNTQKKRNSIGFIAQEAEELVPEAVKIHDLTEVGLQSDHRMLEYRRLFVHTFGAIQYLESEIQSLMERLEALQSA